MDDLISRCDVLSYILYVQNSGLGKKKALEYIYKYVENVIATYDVDKVVEELDKDSVLHEINEWFGLEKIVFLDTAIEIVRKGGAV